ncbi:MAG: hypothetical protein ACRYE8_02380 [Janthinobacterium lividum]|uniref:DUF883 domain-containing protein n=2 Tax=Rickettsia bellii TaxID=33990 RepID=Q1RJL2_RICBR|nr:hypothetical protein [Rickettsia bellii]MCC8377034.1 hypothetical protein [Rickettsia endosymbiont of Graphium doson]HJD66036.1 hypothetical protein [Rickettsia endosymbiont of Bembidion nr. Transversale]HJD67086.1 hypothetical protein [Rickettsia endosymbiont of Bembidion lapponicum]ABE04452.1 unknown [Rickettsia bellii RML369-C]ABV79505.1 hypothetical protein A1I_05915 [Rickettsia bellii OSU 85-389]
MKDLKVGSAKEDIEGIKKDIESLVSRLHNLKGKSGDILDEQLDNLSSVMDHYKHKGIEKGKANVADLCESTRDHPLRNLAYAFGAGVLLAILMK